MQVVGEKRKGLRVLIPRLNLGGRIVDRSSVESWRGSCFKPTGTKAQTIQSSADPTGGSLPCPTTRRFCFAHMHQGPQKSPRGEQNGRGVEAGTADDRNTSNLQLTLLGLHQQIFNDLLPQVEIFLDRKSVV